MEAFTVKVDHDAMEVKLTAAELSLQSVNSIAALNERLAQEHVTNGIDEVAVTLAFEKLHSAVKGDAFIVANGTQPQHGKNGNIEFLVNVSGKPIYDGASINDDDLAKVDSVDYKNATRVVSVKIGEKIALIHPPTTGVAGQNLAGKILAARDGKPTSLRLGEGVSLLPDNITVVATLEGRPVFNNKSLIVSQIYEISGDVNFDTGNIRFDGYVAIRGSVQDDFMVEARSVEIDGIVGAAKIICKGNLIIHGGVNGKGRAMIVCQGNADVKYISGSKFELVGDLNVAREIANSTVWCRGTVRAGKIMGGAILALRGIEAKLLGSELGTPTMLQPGVNYETARIEETAQIFSKNIGAIIKNIGPNLGDHKYFQNLSASRQIELTNAYATFLKLRDALTKLFNVRQQLLLRADYQPCSIVVALKNLYNDVTIKTPNCARQFLTSVKGPAGFVDDVNENTIKIVPYSQVAKEFVRAENSEPVA